MNVVKIFNGAENETEGFVSERLITSNEIMLEEFYRYDTELTGEGAPSADFTVLAAGKNKGEFWAVLSYENMHLSGTLYISSQA